jgi:large subunit ribosomal protein L21
VFAVIRDRTRQVGVRVGDVVALDRNDQWNDGDTIAFESVLLVSDEGVVRVGRPNVAGARVQAKVLGKARGPKTVSMRFKRRKNVRRKRGHRTDFTRVEITGIQV